MKDICHLLRQKNEDILFNVTEMTSGMLGTLIKFITKTDFKKKDEFEQKRLNVIKFNGSCQNHNYSK